MGSLIVKKGPRWGLDFTGGNLIEIKFKNPPPMEDVRKVLKDNKIESFEIQNTVQNADGGIYLIRTQPGKGDAASPEGDISQKILATIEQSFPDRSPSLLRKEFVGPTVGKHLGRETALAFVLTFIGIIVYVAFRFHSGIWGASGVIALIHDVFATIGIFSLTNKEITVTIVAALLTIAGYSLNDTVVVYDRIRENLKARRTDSYAKVINDSVNETLTRTVVTGLSTLGTLAVLFFWGGEVTKDFSLTLLLGIVVGTYSSIFVAAPLVVEWNQRSPAKR
jgi:preprotein translocase SecF subunit